MTQIAAELARAGYANYWDHVDRYVRNYLRETQLELTPKVEAFWRGLHTDKSAEEVDSGFEVLREFEGAFQSSIGVNDWQGPEMFFGVAGCCVPEGARALVTAWTNTVVSEADGIRVNMALAHDGDAADVEVIDGGVRVTPHVGGMVRVRPPAWTQRQKVNTDRSAEPAWDGNYVQFDHVRSGDSVLVTWPIPCFQQHIEVGGRIGGKHPYAIRWEGNVATGIEPAGTVFPLFQARAESG
jgi:hypothetical protein